MLHPVLTRRPLDSSPPQGSEPQCRKPDIRIMIKDYLFFSHSYRQECVDTYDQTVVTVHTVTMRLPRRADITIGALAATSPYHLK